MAKNTAAVLDEEIETAEVVPTVKQVINEGINRFIEATGIDGQKARYKAQRAIAFQAFMEAIDSSDFDRLVDSAVANAGELPAGWGLERTVAEVKETTKAPAKATPAKKTPAKKAPAKKAAAPATKTARRRPTR